jgi:hypothetical protein
MFVGPGLPISSAPEERNVCRALPISSAQRSEMFVGPGLPISPAPEERNVCRARATYLLRSRGAKCL